MFGIARRRAPRIVQDFVDSASALASRLRHGGHAAEAVPLPHLSQLEAPATRGRIAAPQAGRAPSSRLPLLQRPGAIAVLDADAQFLDILSTSLPWEWHVEGFREQQPFVKHLQQEAPRRERDYGLQQEIVNAWRADRAGRPLAPQVLAYWRSQPERFAFTSLCLCDASPAAGSGLRALEALGEWTGARVLLTDSEDAALPTEAFNRRLIDQCIARSALNVQVLTDTVLALTRRTDERAQQIWSATFSQAQAALLRADGVADDLRSFAERTWIEWICIGEPFGMLGLDFWGVASWLQLQPADDTAAAAEAAAQHGAGAAAVADIRAGRSVTDLELTRTLGQPGENQAILAAFGVGRQPQLLAGFRRLPQPRGARAIPSYRDWLRRQKVRQGKL